MKPTITPVEVNTLEKPVDELDSAWVALVDEKLLQMAEHQQRMEKRQESLEASMAMNNTLTSEIFEIVNTAKGAFKFFGWIAQFAGMVIKIGAFIAASYATAKLAFPHLFKG